MIVQHNGDKEFEKIRQWCEASVDKPLRDDGAVYYLVSSGNDKNEVDFIQLWK
jgi:hypothetical protein